VPRPSRSTTTASRGTRRASPRLSCTTP
jgi:hypothetical protein